MALCPLCRLPPANSPFFLDIILKVAGILTVKGGTGAIVEYLLVKTLIYTACLFI